MFDYFGITYNKIVSLYSTFTYFFRLSKKDRLIESTINETTRFIMIQEEILKYSNKLKATDKEHIHIFERLNESAALNMELAKSGIPVKGISITSEELETYFLNLTGGADHA